jgi:hypothetical protein
MEMVPGDLIDVGDGIGEHLEVREMHFVTTAGECVSVPIYGGDPASEVRCAGVGDGHDHVRYPRTCCPTPSDIGGSVGHVMEPYPKEPSCALC